MINWNASCAPVPYVARTPTPIATSTIAAIDRVGVFRPKMVEVDGLGPGEIGYITAQIKQVADTRVGDTITDDKRPTAHALPGFKPAQPASASAAASSACCTSRSSRSGSSASSTSTSSPPRRASSTR